MTKDPIGDRLDTLGVTASLDEGDLISDVVVIMKVVNSDGKARVSTAWSDGIDWITRRGMLEVVRDVERVAPPEHGHE